MGIEMGELSASSGQREIDLISAVSELHGLSSLELSKLVKDSHNNVLRTYTKSGSCVEIDIEKLARYLPLHLIAKIMLSDRDEELLKYLLCGIRLLHSLCDLAPRHPKLEQILIDDMRVMEQVLDLIFYLLAFLSNFVQGNESSVRLPFLHSALVACTLYLLTGCLSSSWQDIATVLVCHQKVYAFMDVAFTALHVDITFLQSMLSGQSTDFPIGDSNADEILYYACQQSEGSLQFLQFLCQQKSFREHFVKNKELCVEGGVLSLAEAVLSLDVSPTYKEFSSVIASVSRMKSRMLSILSHLWEAESSSYLDEVATSPQSMNLAIFVASKILVFINNIGRDHRQLSSFSDDNYPTGHLQLNALRLADILSDDSNFRSYMSMNFAKVLIPMILLPHREFLSMWCASELSVSEKDANLEYDSFVTAGCILDSGSSLDHMHMMNLRCHLSIINMKQPPYAHERTSLLVKVIANLHCYVPQLCEEKENLFLNNFLEFLKEVSAVLPAPNAVKSNIVKSNLRSLLSHAESLTPVCLNEEDVQLLRMFVMQCRSLIASDEHEVDQPQGNNFEEPIYKEKLSQLSFSEQLQEDQNIEGCSPHHPITIICTNGNGNLNECTSENSAFQVENQFNANTDSLDQTDDRSWHVGGEEIIREIENGNTSGSDSGSTQGKSSIDTHHNVDFPNSSEHINECGFTGLKGAERSETVRHEENQRRKRKRTLMNEKQISLIEMALSKEPDMQRNAASIQEWSVHLSGHGSEVTTSQLKNWLNNRKAKLAKAAKDSSVHSGGANLFTDNPIRKGEVVLLEYVANPSSGFVQCKPGQHVVLIGGQGEEIGKAKVFQVQGEWLGFNLEESQMCVVDITELKVDEMNKVPYPCEATCATFYEARKKFGLMRILWGSNKTFMLAPQ